jgi:hypothetical protein
MKTYIYRTLFIGVLVSSYLTHSQIRPNNNRGEYLRLDEVKDLKKAFYRRNRIRGFFF